MSEVLNISVTADARDLFVDHDIQTIKKIKQTALDDITHKQNVLRSFIGDNYRPLLQAPSIIENIKSIMKEAHSILTTIDELRTSNSITAPVKIHPFAAASQLYLRCLQKLDSKEFKTALDFALEASEKLRSDSGLNGSTVAAMTQAIDSLPRRILNGIEGFLIDPGTVLSAESLIDCFSTVQLLFSKFGDFSKQGTAAAFLQSFVVRRVEAFVRSAEQVGDLCLALISLVEALVAFLAASKKADLSRLLDSVLDKFCASFKLELRRFEAMELRDILRDAKSIADAVRSRTAAPRFVSAAREISLNVNFWNVAFLRVFADLAGQSIGTAIARLELPDSARKILNELGPFDAVQFTLGRSFDLKTRSYGVSPLVTNFQRGVDSVVLLISSQLQSQTTQIATLDMLARPLTASVVAACEVLDRAIIQSPLPVCLLAGALNSPSVSSFFSDSVAEEITRLQKKAAGGWAMRTASDVKSLLAAVPRPGAALTYLIRLENAILEAGGHVAFRPLDEYLRKEAFVTVIAHFQGVLRALEFKPGDVEKRRRNEAFAELLFRDFCLLSRVLSPRGDERTRRLFIGKMNPNQLAAAETRIHTENEVLLFQSRELIKLVSSGESREPPQPLTEFDPTRHLELLLANRKK